jgi:hypothetical protein
MTAFHLGNFSENVMWNGSGVTLRFAELSPENDMISLWHFTGNANDSSYYGNNGTLMNNAKAADGRLDFGTGNGWVNVSDNDIYDTGAALTVEFWFRTNVSQSSKTLLVHDVTPTDAYKYMVYMDFSSQLLRFYLATTSITDSVTWNTGIPNYFSDGRWHHFAATFNNTWSGNELRLYVNGISRQTNIITGTVLPGDDGILLGRRGSSYFMGEMDEIAIYNRSLEAGEIEEHYMQKFLAGNYTSQVFDGVVSSAWNRMSWSVVQFAGNNVTFQVRSCALSDCSDGSWMGPDNTSSTFFTSGPAELSATALAQNRYFQYKAFFETNNANVTPLLTGVNITYNAIMKGNVLNLYGLGNCTTLLDDAMELGAGWSCGADCIIMNSTLNITSGASVSLSRCKLVMNNSAGAGTSNIYVQPGGYLYGYGLNLTSDSSSRFYFYGLDGSTADFANSWVSAAEFRGPEAVLKNCTLSEYSVSGSGMVNVRWYMNVYVNDTNGLPVSDASVHFWNSTGDYQGNFTTTSGGWALKFNATEFTESPAGKKYYSNYTINATKPGYGTSYSVLNLTGNGNSWVRMGATPVVGYVDVFPDSPSTMQDLNCSFNFTDNDSTYGFANVTWYNGTTHATAYDASSINLSNATTGYTTILLPAGATVKDDVWNCTVTVWDGYSMSFPSSGWETIGGGGTPYVYAPETFKGSSKRTSFSGTDTVTVRVNVIDEDGAGDLSGAYVSILSASAVKISNATMQTTGTISGGRVYEYNYTLDENENGQWTVAVYTNDTTGLNMSNSSTFSVTLDRHTLYIGMNSNYTDSMVYIPGAGEQNAAAMANATYANAPHKYITSHKNGAVKGIVFTGKSHTSLGFLRSGSNHTITSAQLMGGSQALLVFTGGGWNVIDNRIYDIETKNFLTRAVASFSHGILDEHTVDIFLAYSGIDIRGDYILRKGWRKIIMENNGTSSGKVVVDVSVE